MFLYLLYFSSYDVINDVIMSDADCTPGREPHSVAASLYFIRVVSDRLHTGSHADVERLANESKQRRAEMDRLVRGDRHVHTN